MTFSISAAIGFISLFGVSVMNGILVITYYNELRRGGMGPVDAMFHAAEQRMRPMLMTALSACIGLLPAAMSHRHRQPGAAAAGDRGGRRHADRALIMLVVVPALQTLFLGRDDRGAPPGASAPVPEPAFD